MSQVGGVIKALTMPIVSITDALKSKEQKGGAETSSTVTTDSILSIATTIAFMALAGYLCWKCNVNTDIVLRVIYTILSVIFNTFYLIYYFIYRVIMGKAC